MNKHWIALAATCTLLSFACNAFAGLPCPHDDKKVPEKTKVCRYGTIHQCVDGQWVSTGAKCTQKLQEDAAAAKLQRVLGTARNERLSARLVERS